MKLLSGQSPKSFIFTGGKGKGKKKVDLLKQTEFKHLSGGGHWRWPPLYSPAALPGQLAERTECRVSNKPKQAWGSDTAPLQPVSKREKQI